MILMLKTIKRAAIFAGITGLGVTAAYNFLLDDSAKRVVKNSVKTIKKDISTLQDYINQITGTVIDENDVEYHKEQVLKQWEDLGL